MLKPLNKEQRIKVYKKALELYKKNNSGRIDKCDGMCMYIGQAMLDLDLSRNRVYPGNVSNIPKGKERAQLKEYFPEFVSFMPNPANRWEKDKRFWFTPKVSRGGLDHRIKVLTALAEGKTAKDVR